MAEIEARGRCSSRTVAIAVVVAFSTFIVVFQDNLIHHVTRKSQTVGSIVSQKYPLAAEVESEEALHPPHGANNVTRPPLSELVGKGTANITVFLISPLLDTQRLLHPR